ncbi:MAG TPA: hypothetical protein VF772_27360, partial [Terriglobales bacterium]
LVLVYEIEGVNPRAVDQPRQDVASAMGAVATVMSLPSVPAAKLPVRETTPRNGDVESLPAAPVDPLFAVANPTDGDVEAQLTLLFTAQ